jgi:hypothetical protein
MLLSSVRATANFWPSKEEWTYEQKNGEHIASAELLVTALVSCESDEAYLHGAEMHEAGSAQSNQKTNRKCGHKNH